MRIFLHFEALSRIAFMERFTQTLNTQMLSQEHLNYVNVFSEQHMDYVASEIADLYRRIGTTSHKTTSRRRISIQIGTIGTRKSHVDFVSIGCGGGFGRPLGSAHQKLSLELRSWRGEITPGDAATTWAVTPTPNSFRFLDWRRSATTHPMVAEDV